MEFVESQASSAGAAGLLMVPGPNYLDFEVDLDDDDEEVVIGIRPKSSPQPRRKTSVSDEESDISEPPSLTGSRRVSFADAVGLNLVQVKEFDKWDIPQLPNFLEDTNKDEDEYFIYALNFLLSLPSEEILAKVLDQKVKLESIELLPGTTILKGEICVLNISFTKAVYVRTSLDNWVSHFDLLSEFVPGSSDGHLDRFAFKLTLVPPFAEQGVRVDFCLRYETPNGTFWDNNSNQNYVLFCHKRRVHDKPLKESVNKKSCLKTVSRNFSAEESMSSPERENLAADVTTRQKITNETQSNQSDKSPGKSEDDADTLQVENRRNRSRRNRRKAARMARVRDHFAQKDLTTQDSESLASLEKHNPTAQEQNQTATHSNARGSVQLEDTADGSLSKDSNSKTHENFNLTDAATLANDRRDESKDVSNVATALLQNANNFVSTSEATSPEAAGYCGHASVERDDSGRLVSDSGGFAFGTVVAPLYHEVSGRGVGTQPCSEIYNSRSMKEQQETEERSGNADGNVGKDTGRCYSDGKVESSEERGATSSSDEMLKIDDVFEKSSKIQDSMKKQTNTISDPVYPIDCLNYDLVNASEKILNHAKEIQSSNLTSDHQETFSNETFQALLLENDDSNSHAEMKRDETMLKTEEQDHQFELDKQASQSSSISDINDLSLENSKTNLALPPSNVLFQEEDESFELSLNESLQNECASSITIGTGSEFVDKTLDISPKDFEYEENGGLVDQSASVNDMIVLPSVDIEACNIVVSSHVTKTVTENQALNSQLSQNVHLLDSPTKTSDAMDENSLELEDLTKHVSETPEDVAKSFLLEQTLANQHTHTIDLINERSPPSRASILIVSPISDEENAQLTSELSQNIDLSDSHNEDQTLAELPTCNFENQFLLGDQNEGLVDQPGNNTRDLTVEVSVSDEDTQTKPLTYSTKLSADENTADVPTAMAQSDACGILDEGNLTLLLEQNEDLKNKSSTEHNSRTKTQRQDLHENIEENALLFLERNSCLLDHSANHRDFIDHVCDCDAGSVAETSSVVSRLLEENQSLSLQPSQNDRVTHSDELNKENGEKILAISSNLGISGGENASLFQNEGLLDQANNTSESIINLELDQKLNGTVKMLPCQEATMEENAPLANQVSKYSCIGLEDQPSNVNSLLAQSGFNLDSTKTLVVLEKEEEDIFITDVELADHEVIAISGICFEKLDLTEGCVEVEQIETSDGNEDGLNECDQIEDVVESKTNIYCDQPDAISRSVNVEKFEILSQIETMDINLEDVAKTWEVMVDEEQGNLELQDTSEDIVAVVTRLVEKDKLQSIDSKMNDVELSEMAGSQSIDFEYATEDIEKKEDKLEELDWDAQVNNETLFAAFEDKSLCASSEGIVRDCASVNEQQLNERIGSKLLDSVDNMPGCENTDVDEIEQVKIQLKTNEEERFKIPPRRVKSKLSAPMNNVQRSSQDKIVEETTYMPIEIDKTDFLCCSKDIDDNTSARDLIYDQNSDSDGHSESESGSEDEMELYMHCLRAVYGQQSSPKAIKPQQNRDEGFKRVSTTRSKRLSTSLPSISESLDEEQTTDILDIQEKEIEAVQDIAQDLPDSSLKQEDADHLWWKQSFSCRNILKSLLYITLIVIFLAVAYHYDFIACFGLYMISLIWLFFQGDRQTIKNKS